MNKALKIVAVVITAVSVIVAAVAVTAVYNKSYKKNYITVC